MMYRDFDALLEMHANSFQDWRYLYENESGFFEYQFCEFLANSLIQLVEQSEKQLLDIVLEQYRRGKIRNVALDWHIEI
jgi:hypothetical protein